MQNPRMMTYRRLLLCGALLALAVGCGERASTPEPVSQPPDHWWTYGTHLPPEPQRPGDPEKGWELLIHEGYVGCGLPASAFPLLKYVTPVTPNDVLPDRTGPGANFPYKWNHHVTDAGVELAVPNCLMCHAERFNGELVIGLGDVTSDYTADFAEVSKLVDFLEPIQDQLFTPEEQAELSKFVSRIRKLGGGTRMRTVGTNPANIIGVKLFSFLDRDTLQWSEEPLLDLPADEPIPIVPPPWWRTGIKSSSFYNGMGRGAHQQIMMAASALCVDDVSHVEKIDAYFHHVNAFISALEPPAYPFAIDEEQAAHGEHVFNANCAGCHGTYGDNRSYPNLVIPLSVIATDPVYAAGAPLLSDFIDWYNDSIYGREARLEPNTGYVAPPLDGIWATAPYFHNGSVPTIAHVLKSASRPRFWKRVDFDSTNFDETNLGWPYEELPYGQARAPVEERKYIYDTLQLGHWNTGHTFGDHLTRRERSAVLEYLKTL